MCPQSVLNSGRSLKGVHGLHVVSHAPFVVEEVTKNRDRRPACKTSNTRFDNNILMQRLQHQVSVYFRPIRCTHTGDQNLSETVVNVVTSLPFIALGIQAPRKNLNSKLYANSLIGVGIASSLYHSSRGRIRKFLKWVDYTMIATATVVAFAKRALKDPQLRMAHNVHKASSLVGGMLFVADDVFPETPFIHAAWHLAAAVGVGTCNKLLE